MFLDFPGCHPRPGPGYHAGHVLPSTASCGLALDIEATTLGRFAPSIPPGQPLDLRNQVRRALASALGHLANVPARAPAPASNFLRRPVAQLDSASNSWHLLPPTGRSVQTHGRFSYLGIYRKNGNAQGFFSQNPILGNYMTQFLERLLDARRGKEKAEGQGELTWAEVARRAGIQRSNLYRYKDGSGEPSLAELISIAWVFDVDPGWLAFGDASQAPEPGVTVLKYGPSRSRTLRKPLASQPGTPTPRPTRSPKRGA